MSVVSKTMYSVRAFVALAGLTLALGGGAATRTGETIAGVSAKCANIRFRRPGPP
jgi:hypothetical protein